MLKLNQNITTDIYIRGAWYTNSSVVTITNQTVNSITVVNDNLIIANITTGNVNGFFDLKVTNEGGETIFTSGIQVELSTYIDLRDNGTPLIVGTDVRVRTGMSVNRDATGMFFTGTTPWSSWVKFPLYQWNRGDNKDLELIFTRPSSFMMIGIGSNATNETSTAQYAQAEVEAYFNSSTNFWGLYGNNGTVGSAGNQSVNLSIAGGSGVYKIKFESDGDLGDVFTLYELPSANPSDWADESNILQSFVIGGTLNPNENILMPFIIPQNGGTQRFIALK